MSNFMTLIIMILIISVCGAIFIVTMQTKANNKFEEWVKEQGFNVAKKYSFGNGVLLIDEQNRKWAVNNFLSKYKIYKVIPKL